ncbi:MAG: collagen-like protein, partial [Chloroflexia bacterium]
WSSFQPMTSSRAARFLDWQLSLDERVSTFLELRRSCVKSSRPQPGSHLQSRLLSEASSLVMDRLDRLPPRAYWRPSRKDIAIVFVAVAILGGSVAIPTPLDAVRAEKAALRGAVESRLADLEALRLEIAADPLVTGDAKRKLDAELWALQQKLRTSGLGRSELVAALSSAEEKVRQLASTPVSAFSGLLQAAQLVWNQAVNTQYWAADTVVSETELSRAADATDYLSDFAPVFTAAEERLIALTLDRAALLTGVTHPLFTTDFNEAAEALRVEGGPTAAREIEDLAQRFRDADKEFHTAQALERALAQLDESRHDVAQAGTVVQKRGQVGFRRRGPQTPAQARVTPTITTLDAAGLPAANTPRPAQGIAPGSGANPDSEGSAGPQPAKTGTPGSSGSAGMPGAPPSGGNDQNSTGRPSDPGSAGRPGGEGPKESAPGGGGDGEDAGTLQGPLTGPVGGSSGAVSRVPNPQGSGPGGSGQSSGATGGDGETISIPEPDPADTSSSGKQPEDDGSRAGGGEGGQAVGDSGGTQERSSGALTSIKTPYKEVVQEYSERATQGLERTYIPSDAKEYVKQYFTVLGK